MIFQRLRSSASTETGWAKVQVCGMEHLCRVSIDFSRVRDEKEVEMDAQSFLS